MKNANLMQILKKLNRINEKADEVQKLVSKQILSKYCCSEIHCIDVIGRFEGVNATKIANELRMTRGAISKLTKKLQSSGLIESYMLDSNKKEVYFMLTEKGQDIYNEHEKYHEDFEKRSSQFFQKYTDDELKLINEFMEAYDLYIDDKIKTLKGKE